ncbi:TetR family transcriptional regulator [Nocardioides terrisoli]|uniref:TetR family transcriptional regulator n=1 Tax=Nocardioides terrisoli TaxID=3388267 RepID=UPI00287B6B0D|nr:TetR family transcriptional regulator [Nocardioides marmorisolisilvae]
MTETEVPGGTRVERKERTRRAILDAALRLSGDGGLSALSLRQVAREVGVVPTAFYRHFASVDELGLTLVDESFASLRGVLRDVRQGESAPREVIARSVQVLDEHVRVHREHFAFIARERTAGPPAVRRAVRHQLELVERELAIDLAQVTGSRWSSDDLRVLSNLIVNAMVATAEDILAADGRPAVEAEVRRRAATQLRMVVVGALRWRSDHTDPPG